MDWLHEELGVVVKLPWERTRIYDALVEHYQNRRRWYGFLLTRLPFLAGDTIMIEAQRGQQTYSDEPWQIDSSIWSINRTRESIKGRIGLQVISKGT